MGHLHSDLPQALQICCWPQTNVPHLMDGHCHLPNSLNQNPGDAAGCDLHRAMTPLDLLWKRLTRDLHVATDVDRFLCEASFLADTL